MILLNNAHDIDIDRIYQLYAVMIYLFFNKRKKYSLEVHRSKSPSCVSIFVGIPLITLVDPPGSKQSWSNVMH